jgi:hypothetical protein
MDPWGLRRIITAMGLYLLLIVMSLGLDRGLHALGMVWVGRYSGAVGTALILLSFAYSLRKRKMIGFGSAQTLLDLHEVMCWVGSVLILVHAGIHFNALLPWIATLILLIVVASGFTGKVLLAACRTQVREREHELRSQGLEEEEIRGRLLLASLAVDVMRKWRSVHLPLTALLAAVVAIHAVSLLIFSR